MMAGPTIQFARIARLTNDYNVENH